MHETEQILDAIRSRMRRRKLSTYRVAEVAGVSRVYLLRCLNGDRTPTTGWALQVAAALDLVALKKS